jgi:hypothetical protein
MMFSPRDDVILFGPAQKGKVPCKKKPRGVSGGAGFLFFSKEVTANTITGKSVCLIVIGFGSSYFCSYFSSGV